MFLWERFWMSLTFTSVDWVEQIALHNVGEPHLISSRPEWNKGLPFLQIRGCSSCLTVFRLGHWLFLPSDGKYTISSPGSPSSADCRSLGPVSLYNPLGSTFLENPNRWPDWFSKSDGWINESFLHFIYLSIHPRIHSFLHPFLPTSHLAVYDGIFREITRSSALGRSKLRCPAGKVWMVSPQFCIN